MKVLVDTSVWIDFFNDYKSPAAEALARLIDEEVDLLTCGVILSEFMQGLKDPGTIKTLEKHFREMDWLTPQEPETYLAAAALFRDLRRRGITVRSTIDCLIAQLALENKALILTKDKDLSRIIDSGVMRLQAFPIP